jgi:lipopolysaccharide transport system permease protein
MDDPSNEIRYTPDSQLRRPRQFFRATTRGLRASWAVAGRLLVRDLRSTYRQSLLGYVWIFGPALATTGVWVLLNSSKIVNGGPTRVPYPIFVFAGSLLWQGFVDGISSPIQQLTAASTVLNKVNFPTESLLLAGMGKVLLNGFIRLILVVPVFIFYGINPGWGVILAPIGLVTMAALGFAIGLVIAPIGALYQDVPQGISVVTTFWFFITPIAFNLPTSGAGHEIGSINPVTYSIDAARDWLTGGPTVPGVGWFIVTALSAILLIIGWIFFRLSVPHLVDRIST